MSTVYSTDKGKHCAGCHRPTPECVCRDQRPAHTDGIVRLQRQVKGRNGKPVVIISGLPLNPAELKVLAKKLKSRCGVGGSIEQGNILIQGDQRELLKQALEADGYTVKVSGG
ncbi:MAG: stress response translation initiation inhibitor YciH [Proteobacteria bacterium]|jgi:translation initiation factor 1|nr:stress response translation initiation inhibitor YciH [Pseudomonadota bacterium]MDA1301190.1 stress response translation initiation inhibitor YciH [Pseudomonadota bacterium]